MKKLIYLITLILFVSCSDNSADDPEVKTYTSISGNTYASEAQLNTMSGVFLIFKMGQDSTIIIEERQSSAAGSLLETKKGIYHYNHPELELKVQSICDDCYNYYTATVADDRKSFSYDIWDITVSETKQQTFEIVED